MIYLILFLEFFKIGLFTFGGGYAMIPLVKEVVLKYEWLTEDRFFDFIGVCESSPGPIALNMATYVGASQGGFLGSILASLGVVLPSFIVILIVATILKKISDNVIFKSAVDGIKPVTMGLILSAGVCLLVKTIGINYGNNFEMNFDYISIIIFSIIAIIYILFKVIFKKKINPIILIITSAIMGLVICLIFK